MAVINKGFIYFVLKISEYKLKKTLFTLFRWLSFITCIQLFLLIFVHATESQPEELNIVWASRIQADVEEYVRLLDNDDEYEQALEKLSLCSFQDLLSPELIAIDLLSSVKENGRGVKIIRPCCYSIIKRNIRKLRSKAIEKIIFEIDACASNKLSVDEIAELDVCASLLKLIPCDDHIHQYITENLHREVEKKRNVIMISLILDSYKKMRIVLKKQWFPIVCKIEEMFDGLTENTAGLVHIKKYIYAHHRADWRVMSIVFQRMAEIINTNPSEDMRDTAYWIGMAGRDSIKIAGFADPTPILCPTGGYAPVLCNKGRSAAVYFLQSLKKNKDEDIVHDVEERLKQYQRLEQNEFVRIAYIMPESATHSKNEEKHIQFCNENFSYIISLFSSAPIGLQHLEKMFSVLGINHDIEQYFDVSEGVCTLKKTSKTDKIEVIKQQNLLAIQKKILLALSKTLIFFPKKIKTWKLSRYSIHHIEKLLTPFIKDDSESLDEILDKLITFYGVTKSNREKLQFYTDIQNSRQMVQKKSKLLSLRTPYNIDTLEPRGHDEYFNKWKKEFDLRNITITNMRYNGRGNSEFEFLISVFSGESFRVKAFHENKKFNVQFSNGKKEQFLPLLKRLDAPSKLRAFSRVKETIGSVIMKEQIAQEDAFIIIEFFENVLIGKEFTQENILLSSFYFLSMFGFTVKSKQCGVPNLMELHTIFNRKLFLTYLYHVYGHKVAETAFLQHNQKAIEKAKVILFPKTPIMPEKLDHITIVSRFYNSIWHAETTTFNTKSVCTAYSKIVDELKNTGNYHDILYEASLALQKVFIKHLSECHFSVRQSVFLLPNLLNHLSKLELTELRPLIVIILSKTDPYYKVNKYSECIKLLSAFNRITAYLYIEKNIHEQELKKLHKIMWILIKSIENTPHKTFNVVEKKTIETICCFYTYSTYLYFSTTEIESLLKEKLKLFFNADYKDQLFLIFQLAQYIKNYYILNGEYSALFTHMLAKLLSEVIQSTGDDINSLLLLIDNLFPISPILWISPLDQYFLTIVESVLNRCKENYNIESLDELTSIINVVNELKESIKLFTNPKRCLEIKNQLNIFYTKAISDLINGHIYPAWKEFKENKTLTLLKKTLSLLNLNVKEDSVFLKQLESRYQDFIFCDTKNPFTLEMILTEIQERFNHRPEYSKLLPIYVPTYDSNGKLVEERKSYDIIGHLLGICSKINYLKLAESKKKFLTSLISPIYKDEKIMVTGFGAGGKMKTKLNSQGFPENAILPLVELSSLTEGVVGKILEAIPNTEAYYYWQRMFNPASGDGDVVSGVFNVMYADDRTVNFGPITNADGCGFINSRILGRCFNEINRRTPYSARTPIQTYQAIHHNKRAFCTELFDNAVSENTKQILSYVEKYLASSTLERPSIKEFYSTLTTGGIVIGRNYVAIPAKGNDKVIVPLNLRNSDIVLGKTPYEKPRNIVLKYEKDIAHLKSQDNELKLSAEYLKKLSGIQYSFIGTHTGSLSFAKGVLVIIPEDLWEYGDVDIIFCTKDEKVNSSWKDKKRLPTHGTVERMTGVLTPVQKYGPGSFIALSTNIQIDEWNGDYDGDIVSVEKKEKDTKMFTSMNNALDQYVPYSTPKIPKTFTTAKNGDGSFHIFRFSSIIQARTANLLTNYTRLYDLFIALKKKYASVVAYTLVNMKFFEKITQSILVDVELSFIKHEMKKTPEILVQKILSAGIKTGSDSFKSAVDWSYFKAFEGLLTEIFINLGIPDELEYFKKLSIDMHRAHVSFSKVQKEAKYQSKFFDSIPLHVLYEVLKYIPNYKKERLEKLLAKQVEQDISLQPILNDKLAAVNKSAGSKKRRASSFEAFKRVTYYKKINTKKSTIITCLNKVDDSIQLESENVINPKFIDFIKRQSSLKSPLFDNLTMLFLGDAWVRKTPDKDIFLEALPEAALPENIVRPLLTSRTDFLTNTSTKSKEMVPAMTYSFLDKKFFNSTALYNSLASSSKLDELADIINCMAHQHRAKLKKYSIKGIKSIFKR